MPRETNSDFYHAASANHRIPRNANRENSAGRATKRSSRPGRRPVPFHGNLVEARERADLGRDIGVALCRGEEDDARFVLPLLDRALVARPDDVAAREAKGFALSRLGRDLEALTAFQEALGQEPGRESTLVAAAYLTARMDRSQDAIAFWHRAIAINPWRSDYLAELALIHLREGHWQSAAAACREALELNPSWVEVRKLLVRCYLELGDAEAARSEHATVLSFEATGSQ